MAKLIFYTRQNCHLCDIAKTAIYQLRDSLDFEVEVRDVDDHPDWVKVYGNEVPVGIIGDRKVFKYRVHEGQLRRAIMAP